jgi:hypothetical protein
VGGTPIAVTEIYSSFFEDPKSFEPGSAVVDCGLIRRNLPARWHATVSDRVRRNSSASDWRGKESIDMLA